MPQVVQCIDLLPVRKIHQIESGFKLLPVSRLEGIMLFIKAHHIAGLLVAAGVFTAVFPGTTSRKCSIKQLVGTVKVRRGTSVKWNDARPKMPLRETDAIRTFVESEVELETGEGSTIKIGENTAVELKTLNGNVNEQHTSLNIMNGAIIANVKKLVSTGSSFEFETPTATAAIRGTVVGLEVNREQTRVKVYEGRVLVTPQGSKNSVELQPNQMGTVKKGGEKVAVEKFDEKTPVPLSAASMDTTAASGDTLKNHPDSTAAGDLLRAGDSSAVTDTSGHSGTSSGSGTVLLALSSPTDASTVAPQAQIAVNGTVKPAGTTVTVNGKSVSVSADGSFKTMVAAPAQPGDFEVLVNAEINGTSKTLSRNLAVKSSVLQFTVTTPREGQELIKPVIPVSGTVTPGAEVSVLSMKLPVTGAGSFAGQVPIANEAGEYTLDFEATLEGLNQKISRRVVYRPEYRFILSSPPDRQTVTTTNIMIKGEVLPAGSEVVVNGRKMSVTSGGQFSGYLTIPADEGEVALEFEISGSGINRTETRKIFYKKPPDTYRPQLSASLAKSCWNVTVFDRTEDEEITLWHEIDGSREFTTLRPNETTCITLENGIHTYRVYAEDLEKNISNTEVLANYAFLSTTTWLIKMRRPAGNVSFDLPPASPGGEPAYYTIEFTIENLPQDDMRLIREVAITNRTTGRRTALRTFTDNYIEADIELVRQKSNLIQIDVNDINNVTKSQTFQITVR